MLIKDTLTHLAKFALVFAALTLSGGAYAQVALNLTAGWSLLGNSSAAPIDVAVTFGDAAKITTVWKWNKSAGKWAFYAPSMTASNLTTYAQGKGYDVLTSIDPKEGFWVNASAAVILTGPVANGVTLVESDLQLGWNLVGSADNKTPSQLNLGLSSSLNAAGKTITTAWAWDAPSANWKFYAPSLEARGGTVLADYITGKSYLPFSTALSAADGYWLNIGIGTASATPAEAVAVITTSPSPQAVVEAVKQVLARGGVATADQGVTLVPAVRLPASWTIDPGLVFNLAAEAKARAVSGRFTATQLGQMLLDMRFPFAGVGTPGEQLMAFLNAWVTVAGLDPTAPESATPLFLAAMAKAQDPPVDLTLAGNNPDDLRFTLLEIELLFATFDRMYQSTASPLLSAASSAAVSAGLCDDMKSMLGTIGGKLFDAHLNFTAKVLTDASLTKLGLSEAELKLIHGGADKILTALDAAMKVVKMIQVYASSEVMMTVEGTNPVHKPTTTQAEVLVPVTARAGIPDQAWQDYQTASSSYSYQSIKGCLGSMGMPLPSDLKDIGQNAANWRVAFEGITGFPEHAIFPGAGVNDFNGSMNGYPFAMKLAADGPVAAKATVKVKIKEESDLAYLFSAQDKETVAKVRAKVFTAEPPSPLLLAQVGTVVGTLSALLDISVGWIQTAFPPTNTAKIRILYHPTPIKLDASVTLDMKLQNSGARGAPAFNEYTVSAAWAGTLAYSPMNVTTATSGSLTLDSYRGDGTLDYRSVTIKDLGIMYAGCTVTHSTVPVTGPVAAIVGPVFDAQQTWQPDSDTRFLLRDASASSGGSAHEADTVTVTCPGDKTPQVTQLTTIAIIDTMNAFNIWDIGTYTVPGNTFGVSILRGSLQPDGAILRTISGAKTVSIVAGGIAIDINVLSVNGTLRLKPAFAP